MSAPFVVERPNGPPLSDAGRLAVLCDRLRLVDGTTGALVWEPRPGAEPADLARAIDRYATGVTRVAVDPANPLSYLLVECVCHPRRVADCPVHGPKRQGRGAYRARADRRGSDRQRAILAHYGECGSLAATAREFGVSYQRVQQIVADRARRGAP